MTKTIYETWTYDTESLLRALAITVNPLEAVDVYYTNSAGDMVPVENLFICRSTQVKQDTV